MKRKWILKLAVCILGCTLVSYEHIYELNKMTAMRIQIPQIQQEIAYVNEEIDRLNFEFRIAENPVHLLSLAKNAEFSELHYPLQEEVVVLNLEPQISSTTLAQENTKPFVIHPFKLSVILGAH